MTCWLSLIQNILNVWKKNRIAWFDLFLNSCLFYMTGSSGEFGETQFDPLPMQPSLFFWSRLLCSSEHNRLQESSKGVEPNRRNWQRSCSCCSFVNICALLHHVDGSKKDGQEWSQEGLWNNRYKKEQQKIMLILITILMLLITIAINNIDNLKFLQVQRSFSFKRTSGIINHFQRIQKSSKLSKLYGKLFHHKAWTNKEDHGAVRTTIKF